MTAVADRLMDGHALLQFDFPGAKAKKIAFNELALVISPDQSDIRLGFAVRNTHKLLITQVIPSFQ
jgi:hypothetical protein